MINKKIMSVSLSITVIEQLDAYCDDISKNTGCAVSKSQFIENAIKSELDFYKKLNASNNSRN